jgi:hypothetical protein
VLTTTLKGAVISTSTNTDSKQTNSSSTEETPESVNFVPGNITNSINIVKYMGIVLVCLVIAYFISIKQAFSHKDAVLLLPICIYILLWFIVFKGWLAARLLSPIVPMIAILASKVFILQKNKKVKYLILGLCAAQFLGALIFVCMQRKFTEGEYKAFNYVKKVASIKERILSPEEFSLFYYTHSPSIWVTAFNFADATDSTNLLWSDNKLKKKEILEKYRISHIFVQKKRIYDDLEIRHFGGWPKSFVDQLPSMTFMENVFENESISIWKVQS